jgi:hypothetical protein
MYHMADLIEELDVEFMDEVDCEEFLDVPWFISWGWCDNCDFLKFFLVGMWRCVKFITFCCIVINHMTFFIHKWSWGWWNDFWVKDIVQKLFHISRLWDLHLASIWRCVYLQVFGDLMYIGCF